MIPTDPLSYIHTKMNLREIARETGLSTTTVHKHTKAYHPSAKVHKIFVELFETLLEEPVGIPTIEDRAAYDFARVMIAIWKRERYIKRIRKPE